MQILVQELTQLTDRLEQEFHRIERENRLIACLFNGLIAGVAVAIVAWLATSLADDQPSLLLFACLGSSAASVVFNPIARSNSLRSIFIAYAISSAICLVLLPLRHTVTVPIWSLCLVAVAISVSTMRILDAMHPAAVGSAMAFLIYDRDMQSLLLLLMAIVGLLVIVKVMAYVYREELTFRQFSREFRRAYYGAEVMISVAAPQEDVSYSDEPNEEPQGPSQVGP